MTWQMILRRENLNLANFITLLRFLGAWFLIVLVVRGELAFAFVLASLLFVSDLLDGYIAKNWGCKTEFGKHFDPLADKVACWITTLSVVGLSDNAWWWLEYAPPILILALYDTGVTYLRKQMPVKTGDVAKTKTFVLMTGLLSILGVQAELLPSWADAAGHTVVYLSAVAAVWSYLEYREVVPRIEFLEALWNFLYRLWLYVRACLVGV